MVISRSSPPSTSFSGDCASCATSTGDIYCENCVRICFALLQLPDEAGENQRRVDRGGRQQRISEIDQKLLLAVEIPGHSDQDRCEQRADQDQGDRSQFRGKRDHQQSEHQRGTEFEQRPVGRLRKQLPGYRGFKHLRVDLDAGMADETGVVLMSLRPTAEVPISTSL